MNNMHQGFRYRYLLIACLAFLLFSCTNHTDPLKTRSKFFVVRHAERYPGFNGHLTWYGRQRAAELAALLKDSGVSRIYVTPYSRTLETADSLRFARNIDTAVYLLDSTGADLVTRLKARGDYGRTVLIVGHSSSIGGILHGLGVKDALPGTPDTLSNLIYEVINNHGKVDVRSFRFGAPSIPDTVEAMP